MSWDDSQRVALKTTRSNWRPNSGALATRCWRVSRFFSLYLRFSSSVCRMLRREGPDPVEYKESLETHRLRGPECAVVIDHGDALGDLSETRRVKHRNAFSAGTRGTRISDARTIRTRIRASRPTTNSSATTATHTANVRTVGLREIAAGSRSSTGPGKTRRTWQILSINKPANNTGKLMKRPLPINPGIVLRVLHAPPPRPHPSALASGRSVDLRAPPRRTQGPPGGTFQPVCVLDP